MKKIYMLITILVLAFLSFTYFLYSPKNYTVDYTIGDYKIMESYVNNIEVYKIIINFNGREFPLLVDIDYNKSKKIITNIDETDIENGICLSTIIKNKEYQVCYKNNQLVDYRLINEETSSEDLITEYNKTKIYNYNKLKYYIWNYKGYNFISEEHKFTFNILNQDQYDNLLSYQYDDYLITPNYDNQYYFTELLIINNKNLKMFNVNINNEISYSSRFLGGYKNNIYLLDEKNHVEYKINIKNNKVKIVNDKDENGIIYRNHKIEYIPIKNIINDKLKFLENIRYNYQLINNKLYHHIDGNKILISNKNIKEIIKIDNENVYYLSDDALYSYSPNNGENKLLKNNEWNFNYKNKIFIFD